MKIITAFGDLPARPTVYALYGGQGKSRHVAYVGVTGNLKTRLIQHLERRDSSVSSGTTAVGLNPDYVTEVRWWRRQDFRTRYIREAAELVAFEVLSPALRSRGKVQDKAHAKAGDSEFRREMTELFEGEPEGCMRLPTLNDAMDRIAQIEKRLLSIEKQLARRR